MRFQASPRAAPPPRRRRPAALPGRRPARRGYPASRPGQGRRCWPRYDREDRRYPLRV